MCISRGTEDYSAINKKLIDICGAREKRIVNESFGVTGLTFIKLRDTLVRMGKIHLEDSENSIYVAIIPGGFAKRNYATVVFELQEGSVKIAAYADEGIINQHTSEGVINEFRKCIEQYCRE